MSCGQFHLIDSAEGCHAIVQGKTLDGLVVFAYPANLTGYTARGRVTYLNPATQLLDSLLLRFDPLTYTATPTTLPDGRIIPPSTFIKPVLGATETRSLPHTPKLPLDFNLATTRQPEKFFWQWEIEVIAPTISSLTGEALVLSIVLPSWVQVLAEVEVR